MDLKNWIRLSPRPALLFTVLMFTGTLGVDFISHGEINVLGTAAMAAVAGGLWHSLLAPVMRRS